MHNEMEIEMTETVQIGALSARLLAEGEGFALVEHGIAPRGLAAPVHTHRNEDEFSYVLEGQVGFELGGEVSVAGPGELVAKPRGIPHAFWNAGDEPARLLELISPPGFERYFAELAPLRAGEPDFEGMARLQASYGLSMEFESIGRLTGEHALKAYKE